MADPISGKVVLITGPARGIGEETARQLAARGARLSLVGMEPARLGARGGGGAAVAGGEGAGAAGGARGGARRRARLVRVRRDRPGGAGPRGRSRRTRTR